MSAWRAGRWLAGPDSPVIAGWLVCTVPGGFRRGGSWRSTRPGERRPLRPCVECMRRRCGLLAGWAGWAPPGVPCAGRRGRLSAFPVALATAWLHPPKDRR